MRVAVLLYPVGSPDGLRALAKGLTEGLQANGHQVDTFDLKLDDTIRLGMYEYICVGTNGLSPFSAKIDPGLTRRLDGLGTLSGKRCFAFVQKKMLFTEKLLVNLMKGMEKQGMFMRNSGIFKIPEDARLAGSSLVLERTN